MSAPRLDLGHQDASLILHLDVADDVVGLRLLRRDGCASLDVPFEDGMALIPLINLTAKKTLRWDVHCMGMDGSVRPLCAQPPDAGDRHFFQWEHDGHGVSAYLSDSLGSVVLLCAPTDLHRRAIGDDAARNAFPRWLETLPLESDLVLFESFFGKAYGGNPRYIYEALREIRPDLRCVWVYEGNESIPGNPRRVRRGSPEYFRFLATAGYRVNNIRFQCPGRKPQARYLQTWHGTPLKHLGYDIEATGPEVAARASFYQESRGWTTLLSPNPFSTTTLRRAFRYDGPVLEAGYPLSDPLVAAVPDRVTVATELGLSPDRRYVLYAPTWRDHRPVGHWQFDFDLHLDLLAISAALSPEEVLLVRAHHLVSEGLDPAGLPANIIDVSQVDDASRLCALADVLVTDYSSIFFDFAVTGRPVLFYCYDLDFYAEQVRGFYLDMERDLPGPLARTTEELLTLLRDLPAVQACYAERYIRFRDRFCQLADGNAARRVVEAFFGPHVRHAADRIFSPPPPANMKREPAWA